MKYPTLSAILDAFIVIHDQLLETAEQKRVAIIAGDFERFTDVVNQEQSLTMKLKTLEEERIQMTFSWMSGRRFRGNAPTIEDCLPLLPTVEVEKVNELRETLLEKINLLKQENELNLQLIRQSLQFTNMSLELMQPEKRLQNYHPDQMRERPVYQKGGIEFKA